LASDDLFYKPKKEDKESENLFYKPKSPVEDKQHPTNKTPLYFTPPIDDTQFFKPDIKAKPQKFFPIPDQQKQTKPKEKHLEDKSIFKPPQKEIQLPEKIKYPEIIPQKKEIPEPKYIPKIPTTEKPKVPKKKVVFQVKCQTSWGQQVLVVGSSASLGSWNIDRAIPLTYSNDIWKSDYIDAEPEFEYKYVIEDHGSYYWEQSPNRKLIVKFDLIICEVFGSNKERISVPLPLEKDKIKYKKDAKPTVTFKVFCKTLFGEEVFLSGSNEFLGAWDPLNAVPLQYISNYWWQSPEILPDADFDYKYIKSTIDQKFTWEDDPNRKFNRRKQQHPLVCLESFNQPYDRSIPEENNSRLNVMTFNVRIDVATDPHKWNDRKFVISQVIKSRKPHLIGLQEPAHHQLEDLLKLNPKYRHIGIGRSGGTNGEYSPILYDSARFEVIESGTFWLSTTPDTVSKAWNSACLRICTWGIFSDKQNVNPESSLVMMFNTHLDHISPEARVEGIKLIMDKIRQRPDIPIILTGDFNVTPEDEVIKIAGSTLYSTYTIAADNKNENVGTFTGWTPSHDNNTIDYIFVNKYLQAILNEVITEFDSNEVLASDHRPVYSELLII